MQTPVISVTVGSDDGHIRLKALQKVHVKHPAALVDSNPIMV
jgi:hypothetical protein